MEVGTAMGEKDLIVERYTNYPEEKVMSIIFPNHYHYTRNILLLCRVFCSSV